MENKLTITPEQFGLEKKQASTIEEAFKPKIEEREILANQYGEIIKKDINDETCQEATILRRQLVKVRTGIADIHKKQKSFYLAAGKFVDAWKNKETLPVTQMEEGLSNIETHFEKIEEEKREAIRKERSAELEKYETVYGAGDLALMDDDVWKHFLNGIKSDYEAKKAEEKRIEDERIEAQRKQDLFTARKEKLIQFAQFNILSELTIETIEKEFIDIVEKGEKLKDEFDKEQKRIRAENERLRKDKEKQDKETKAREAELKRVHDENEEKERRLNAAGKARSEMLTEIGVNLSPETCKGMSEDVWAEFYEDKNKAFQAEENRKFTEKLKAEQDRKAELAPDKERLTKWIADMTIQDIVNDRMSKESVLIADEVTEKFNAFKKWATEKVKEIK